LSRGSPVAWRPSTTSEGNTTTLEAMTAGATVSGVVPDALVTVVSVTWFGDAIELTYRLADGWADEALG
jgi:hypothetical protein